MVKFKDGLGNATHMAKERGRELKDSVGGKKAKRIVNVIVMVVVG